MMRFVVIGLNVFVVTIVTLSIIREKNATNSIIGELVLLFA